MIIGSMLRLLCGDVLASNSSNFQQNNTMNTQLKVGSKALAKSTRLMMY
jgi:hypothetical protein